MWFILCAFICLSAVNYVDATCDMHKYSHWRGWSPCSEPCGGGTRRRSKISHWLGCNKLWDSEDCNTFCNNGHSYSGGKCQCPNWRSGRCCQDCVHIHILHCKPGPQACGGSPDGIKCTDCNEPYYSAGYGRGCEACPPIADCESRHCTSPENTKCLRCNDDKVFFLRTHSDTKCERLCAWNNHYCWPGECSDTLTASCRCASGFRPVKTSSETSCQLVSTPTIETCETRVKGSNGELKRAASRTNSTACDDLTDVYGNYQPRQLEYDLLSNFDVNIGKYKDQKPSFITESHFGLTDLTLMVYINHIHGQADEIMQHHILTDTSSGTQANTTSSDRKNLTITLGRRNLADGDWLCMSYEAKGGGYLKSFDKRQTTPVASPPVPYTKTVWTKRLCYRYDSSSPEHCALSGRCGYEPIQIDSRITRNDTMHVKFEGWVDPVPIGGNTSHASGIESYEIIMYEVVASKTQSKVSTTSLYSKKVITSKLPVLLNLHSKMPKLYAIYIEVKDVADNVKQSRRFVLYDNSSILETRIDQPLFVESASPSSNYTWQTHHHEICLNWTSHFYNRFYLDNPLLNPVEPDPSGLIAGTYEQHTGVLPVSGTPNVDGIINFKVSWSLNAGVFSQEKDVLDFQRQHYCNNFNVNDGQTYTINIRAVDIAGNNYAENRTVHIDRSVPHINNIWLVKDGVHMLFVHDRTALSKMKLSFQALDPHSGIREVEWAFGTSDSGSELLTGHLAVNNTDLDCPPNMSDDEKCYCPDVGKCEFNQYTIPLNKLVAAGNDTGDHNRNYFFTIKVTNHVLLSNIEHLDILVDESPPETGVIMEGPTSSADYDYTSDDSFMVHWHGFIDHESGINVYRVALADHCLTKDDMSNTTHIDQVAAYIELPYTETSTRIPANFTGKMYTSIVAINNAMDMSDPACSDGITRDTSAPHAYNVTIQNARWAETIICIDGRAWLLNSEMKKLRLNDTADCAHKCLNLTSVDSFPGVLPNTSLDTLDAEISDFLCQTKPVYNKQIITYLPDDHIYLQWQVEDDGSQINEFYIGIGLDPSEKSSPSEMKYTSTGKKTSFNKHHVGIGSSQLFYIFIKVENKAGLERISTIGPLLIDQTAPLYTQVPAVVVDNSYVVATWDTDTFYDMEQTELIDQIFFQFGHDGHSVTPLMEWRHDTSSDCPGRSGLCISYPIRKLQQYDTDIGLEFYISLFVYNKAGHPLQVDTDTFQLPSKYPPGNAIISDVDPQYVDHVGDIDVHFTASTLCARWSGFRHHENISLEFGVGESVGIDDIIRFHQIGENRSYCETSPKFLPGVKYHVLIRSTCSGGQTVSASNGVTIVTQAYVASFLKVYVGKQCRSLPEVAHVAFDLQNDTIAIEIDTPLEIGTLYHIYGLGNIGVDIKAGHGQLKLVNNDYLGAYLALLPYVHRPYLSLNNYTSIVSINNDAVNIVRCLSAKYIPIHNSFVHSFWYWFSGNDLPFNAKIGFQEKGSTVDTYFEAESLFTDRFNISTAMLHTPYYVEAGASYSIAVRPCAQDNCLTPALSDNFTFVTKPPTGTIEVANIDFDVSGNCYEIDMKWQSFQSESPVVFYQWALSGDDSATQTVTDWSTEEDTSTSEYQITGCLSIPHELYRTLFACVRAYTEGEQSTTTCRELQRTSPGAYRRDVVYEIDTSSSAWPTIKEVITSSNLGDVYKMLHDSELDFGTPSATVAGVVVYGSERTLNWFLMTRPEIPAICQNSPSCVKSDTSVNGFIEFEAEYIRANTIYYTCALSNATYVERKLFTERLEELRVCSDGFVLDDSPPFSGDLHVNHHNGYLTEMSHIRISWDGFTDNIDATSLGYVDSIKSYSYAIGKRAGGDDIFEVSDVGLSHVAVVNLTGLSDGTIVYVTVKATDQAGLSTVVTSQELTVDTSPPVVGTMIINQSYDTKYVTNEQLKLRPVGFHDDESGIDHYEWSVGSTRNSRDIVSGVESSGKTMLQIPVGTLHDGHSYFITVKAINRAGIASVQVIQQFTFDGSSPTGGHVIDGPAHSKEDIDFQSDIHHITSLWRGFDDIHSGLKAYSVGLGLKPYDDDVEAMFDVGLSTEITWNGSYVPGQRYYTTVEACNYAGLCTKRSSNGIVLDNSPPIHGIVRIGSGGYHARYIPRSTSAHIHWHGFLDPQSDIQQYEACIGSQPGKCDVEPKFNCLLQSNILKTGLTLPDSQKLFATVYAYNNAGMRVHQSSDAFQVDETAPSVVSAPIFLLEHYTVHGFTVQWEPSVLSIAWMFEDDESPILDHTVTLKTHHEGHTPIENIRLGNENNLTLSLDGQNWLKSGDRYYVIVTSCNAAGHCASAQSQDLLIDSSPPHLGGFRPPLLWKTNPGDKASSLSLTWYGFYDQESELLNYFITASRSYNGNELTDGEIVVIHNSSIDNQQTNITLRQRINRDDVLILSVWAQNNAGLNSSIARVSVNALSKSTVSISEGELELEKHSCDVHYCNKDCTCAVIGKPCVMVTSTGQCIEFNSTEVTNRHLPTIEVYGRLLDSPMKRSASSACMSGRWNLTGSFDHISRFEWSMGLINQPIGEGVFDLKTEIPWNDVGQRNEVVYCLKSNRSLEHNKQYVIYVRVWYKSDQNAIFTSKPIKIDQTAPAIRRGKSIKDSDATCDQDFDFIDWMYTVTACWGNVFSEKQSEITHYVLSFGTSPGADDVFNRTSIGLKTNLTLANLTLSHGTTYYFTVTAHNSLGLHTSTSSDGFVVDMDNPTTGMVFNTDDHVNTVYQSANSSFSVSWHGFVDHFAGITRYLVALTQETNTNESTFYDVGLQNTHTFTNVHLQHGEKYVAAVKAVDAAGHESDISISQPTIIDVTPPEGFECIEYNEIYSYTELCSGDGSYNILTEPILNCTSFYHIAVLMSEVGSSEMTIDRLHVSLPINVAYNGSAYFEHTFLPDCTVGGPINLNGNCQENASVTVTLRLCSPIVPSQDTAITVKQISPLNIQIRSMVLDNESHVKKLRVGLGTTPGGFQVAALTEVHKAHNGLFLVDVPHGTRIYATVIAENHAGLRSTFTARPVKMDHTAPVFTANPSVTVEVETNTTHSALVTWEVVDMESGIKQCICSLGTHPSSVDVHSQVQAETTHSCRLNNMSLQHGDTLYATVLCINGIELSSEAYSSPMPVSIEPPSATNAAITVIPSSEQSPLLLTNQQKPVQTNLTCLRLQWTGFDDVFKMERYEYRLKHGNTPLGQWMDVGKQTMANVDGLHLQSGAVFTAEVRAVNVGKQVSEAVHTEVLVLGEGPRLSGKSMQMTVSGEIMQMNWHGVFNLHQDATVIFTLIIGTQRGYTDVIDGYHSSNMTYSFVIPRSTLVSPTVSELFIDVTCDYVTGMSTSYTASYKLS